MSSVVDYRVRFDFDAVRKELETAFQPAFGLAPDRLAMMIAQGADTGHRRLTAQPPANLRWEGWESLFQYHWFRLLEVARNPVKVHTTSQGLQAVQVLGSFIYVYLPNGIISAYEWVVPEFAGIQLREADTDKVPLAGDFYRRQWMLHLERLAVREVQNDCGDSLAVAEQYTQWQFRQLYACLATHVDVRQMRSRFEEVLPIEPGVLDFAGQLFEPLGFQGSVTVQQYNLALRRREELLAIRRENPKLLQLYALCCDDHTFPKTGEVVQRLMDYLIQRGLTRKGWRMILAMEPGSLHFVREFYEGPTRDAVIDYLKTCEALGLGGHHPRWLLARIFSMYGTAEGRKRVYFKRMSRTCYLENARHLVSLYKAGALPVEPKDGARVADVLDWFCREESRPLTRIQRQGGWRLLESRTRKWMDEQTAAAATDNEGWPAPFDCINVAGYELFALYSARELAIESRAMHNCVNSDTYATDCRDGYRCIASLRLNGRRIATVDFWYEKTEGWYLRAALGACNQPLPQWLLNTLQDVAAGLPTAEEICAG